MNPKEQAEAEKYGSIGETYPPKNEKYNPVFDGYYDGEKIPLCPIDNCGNEIADGNILCDFHNENLPF